ncbi:Hypothetical protein CINCED_3A004825 [Cinara cedri]|uniref:Uncharacterized protein n=1 Tax=Cinara cedri TaxID=506608 RepID=A0A5E4M899_9HEMI|nr:Hypothetical protein CINCED_3A004825 [Cinara cedri]
MTLAPAAGDTDPRSLTSCTGPPKMSSYSSKRGTTITVQCIMPGVMATKAIKIARSSWLVLSPDRFVRSTMQVIELETITTGYFPHVSSVVLNIALVLGHKRLDLTRALSESTMARMFTKKTLGHTQTG